MQLTLDLITTNEPREMTREDKLAMLSAGLKRDRLGAVDREEYLEQQIERMKDRDNGKD